MPLLLSGDAGAESQIQKPKRRKTQADGERRQSSRIFAPYRTIGLVSPTRVPFSYIALGKTTFQITTSIGRSLHTYDLRRGLNLVFLTRPSTPSAITATVAWKNYVLAAWGEERGSFGVWVFQRGKKIAELQIPGELDDSIHTLLVYGSWIIGCSSSHTYVWKSSTYEFYTTLRTSQSQLGEDGLTGMICTMPTYINKIFVGRQDGSVDIWNVSTGKLLYSILPPAPDCGRITALAPTPVLSLLALAFSNGLVIIHNIRTDKTLLQFKTGYKPVTSISFRTDGLGAGEDGRRAGVMATSNDTDGDVTIWDLNSGGRIMGVLRGAHNPPASDKVVGGGINKIEFLPGQPVLVTSGLDNSLKTWIFDESPFSAVPRILHSREGHAGLVTRLKFLPSDADGADAGGKWIISSGTDRSLWGWSLRRDGQSTELSQGNIRKKAKKMGLLGSTYGYREQTTSLDDLKAPEINCIAVSLNRDGGIGAAPGATSIWSSTNANTTKGPDATVLAATGWESVVTGHKGDKFARTWFWGRKKAGRWMFPTSDGGIVTSVAISPCGTFALVGSSKGAIDMFNLQSGHHRQHFPKKLTPAQAKRYAQQIGQQPIIEHSSKSRFAAGTGKHIDAVTGITVDSLNRTVISCGLDGKLKFWNFENGSLIDELEWLMSSPSLQLQYQPSSDLIAVSCGDMSIRVVDIETKKIVRELHGSNDSINDFCFSNDGRWVVAASASMLRVWDLPSGHLIDAVRMSTPCKALAFSSTGEFLATANEDSVGINIWNNRALFTHVPTRQISDEEVQEIEESTIEGTGLLDAAFDEGVEEAEEETFTKLDQLSSEIETLSLVPKSKWQTLVHLDTIKQRNKPREAPKLPEKAPFFLGAIENKSAASQSQELQPVESSRIMPMDRSEGQSSMMLHAAEQSDDYEPYISYFKNLSPSAADLEIRSLNADELEPFVKALTSRLQQKRDYELVQAWMSVLLKIHGPEISPLALKCWLEEQEKEAARLGALAGYCAGVLGFLRSGRG